MSSDGSYGPRGLWRTFVVKHSPPRSGSEALKSCQDSTCPSASLNGVVEDFFRRQPLGTKLLEGPGTHTSLKKIIPTPKQGQKKSNYFAPLVCPQCGVRTL